MPTLVVMAAGLGSRFGGAKQIAEVGPDGEAFCDFAIRDALDAGSSKVVMIVRSDIEQDVRRHIASRHLSVPVAYVRQDEHGPPRTKPWGTGHAVLAAAPEIDDTFLVVNADDYYGRSTYTALCSAAENLPSDRALLAGFRLDRTLSETGEVSRGICMVDDGELVSLVETHGIRRRNDGAIVAADPAGTPAGDAAVSMNCWVFGPRMLDELERGFAGFLAEHGDDPGTEYLLPHIVGELLATGALTVGVVPTSEPWVGVTNPADLDVARGRIADLRG